MAAPVHLRCGGRADLGRGIRARAAPASSISPSTAPARACAYRAAHVARAPGASRSSLRSETELTVRNHLGTADGRRRGARRRARRAIEPARVRAPGRSPARELRHRLGVEGVPRRGDAERPAALRLGASPRHRPASPFSPTNLQESGVDEADLVKSDGRLRLHVCARQQRHAAARRAHRAGRKRRRHARRAGIRASCERQRHACRQRGLVPVCRQRWSRSPAPSPFRTWPRCGRRRTRGPQGATHVEVMRPRTPDCRSRAGGRRSTATSCPAAASASALYVVSRFVPWLRASSTARPTPPTVAANQQLLAATPLSELLPKVRIDGGARRGAARALVDLRTSARFPQPDGGHDPGHRDRPRRRRASRNRLPSSASLETVYASTTNLFVATFALRVAVCRSACRFRSRRSILTDIHQIRIGADEMNIVGSASIEGYLGHDPDKAASA